MSEESVASDLKHRPAPEELAEIVSKLRRKVKRLEQATIRPLLLTTKKPMVSSAIASRRERDLYGVHAYLLVADPTWEAITGATDRTKKRDLMKALQVDLYRELAGMWWDGDKVSYERVAMEHPDVIRQFGLDAPGVRENPLVRAVMQAQLKLLEDEAEEDAEPFGEEEGVTHLGDFKEAAH